jgi:methylthioribose-1-phosphate isomerase
MNDHDDTVSAVHWTDAGLRLLDQRRLPDEENYLHFNDAAALATAIRDMVVRGAPAIGITAAYGVVLAARRHVLESPQAWQPGVQQDSCRGYRGKSADGHGRCCAH